MQTQSLKNSAIVILKIGVGKIENGNVHFSASM